MQSAPHVGSSKDRILTQVFFLLLHLRTLTEILNSYDDLLYVVIGYLKQNEL